MKKFFLAVQCILLTAATISAMAQGSEKGHAPPAAHDIKTAGFSVRIAPAPQWVAPVRREEGVKLASSAMHYDLIDEQIRVEPSGASVYQHIVRIVDNVSGLGPAAQITVDFDPSYQSLVFHKLEISRGAKKLNKLNQGTVKLLQRESKLEYRAYDGRVTASAVLDDVRVGDRIEYSYTVNGMNPVFEGKFLYDTWTSASVGPVALYQLRLLAPENRAIAYRAAPDMEASSSVKTGVRETILRRHAIPQLQWDALATNASYLPERIQFSEYKDWSEVEAWGKRLFAQATIPSPAVRKVADQIRASAPTPEARLQQALDFVQKEVRYFGMEFGAGSHRPAPPATVIEQRFGDCKDKASLLIALLKELDIEAAPVLVSTYYRADTSALLPSPFAFDHVITRVKLDGKQYWLDGTRSRQTGSLAQRQSAGLGRGLVLGDGAAGLTDLPGTDSEERVAVEDKFRVDELSGDITIDSRITYYGEMAEALRGEIASQSLDGIESQLTADYGRLYPKIRSSAPIRAEEVPSQNALRIVQQFTLPEFWRFPEQKSLVGEVGLWSAREALHHPDEPVRKRPFRIDSPGIYRHDIDFEFGEDVYKKEESSHFDDGNADFSYHLDYETKPRHARISAELRLLRDAIDPDEWSAFTDKIVKLRSRFSASITVSPLTLQQVPKLKSDIEALETAVRKGKTPMATAVQYSAGMRNIVLTAELESGRLSPLLKAQALHNRGEQLDNLGRYDDAAKDFDEALTLAPDDDDVHLAAAVNAFSRGMDTRAIEQASKALKLAPSNQSPLSVRAFAYYYSGDYAQAKDDLLTLLKRRSEVDRGYAAIWLYLTARRMGEDGKEAVKAYLPAASGAQWPYQITQMLIGDSDYDHALKAATDNTKDASQLCELYFYTGEKYLIDGDRKHAREFFQKAVNTGIFEYNEYSMAKRSLKKMDEGGAS